MSVTFGLSSAWATSTVSTAPIPSAVLMAVRSLAKVRGTSSLTIAEALTCVCFAASFGVSLGGWNVLKNVSKQSC